jgi:hypothetical protein
MAAFLMFLPAALPASAGEMLTLDRKAFDADLVFEVRLPLDKPIPKNWPNQSYDPKGQAFPGALIDAARKGAKVERILKILSSEAHPTVPEDLYVFTSGSPCWWKAHQRGGLRTLVFLRHESGGATRQLVGVEHESGRYTDLSPTYEALVEALMRASGWHEERMRAVAAEMLWEDERAALGSDNPYLMHLAAAFLREHDSSYAIDAVWGAPGSEGRAAREKASVPPYDNVCR